jgi:hypothetical protein
MQLIFFQFFKVVIGYTTQFLQDISKNVRILELIAHISKIIRNGHILMMYLLYTVEKTFYIVLYFVWHI